MTVAWVLGSGGLLGASLCRQLDRSGCRRFVPAEPFAWQNAELLPRQMANAVESLASLVGPTDSWEIYWAAGVGAMGSSAASLAPETQAFEVLLECLTAQSNLQSATGQLAFASTAGGIYAGSKDDIITENSVPAPTTDYAREKLRQEALLCGFAANNQRATAFIARITTLYGPGQATGKRQGLISHLARNILRNHPVQIYVPYDTIRDYITADDAAAVMIAALRETASPQPVVIKIVASERPTTIAEIVSIFKKIARRAPRIVTSANRLSSLYARRVLFRSIITTGVPKTAATPIAIGIAQMMAAERNAFMRSSGS